MNDHVFESVNESIDVSVKNMLFDIDYERGIFDARIKKSDIFTSSLSNRDSCVVCRFRVIAIRIRIKNKRC